MPWYRARLLPAASLELETKTAAMQCFASQLERGDGSPLLTPDVVERQMAVGEIVFVGRRTPHQV